MRRKIFQIVLLAASLLTLAVGANASGLINLSGASCVQIATKSGRTPETCAATGATFERTKSSEVRTFASYGKTGVKTHRRKNFAPIDRRSEQIQVRYAAIAASSEGT